MSVLPQPPTRRSLLLLLALSMLLAADDLLSARLAIEPGQPSPDLVAITVSLTIAVTALAPAVRASMRAGRAGLLVERVAKLSATSIVSLALALVAAEYVARWVYRDITTTADDRGYFTRRWMRQDPSRPNTYGFREREFSAAKPPGVVRIAVVGDSFTYGNGLKVEQRFSNLLQHELPAGFEVLNFGMPGANTPDHATTIRRKVVPVEADFVLVQWFVNDVEGSDVTGRPVYRPLLPFPTLARRLYDSSALFTVASLEWTSWQASRPGRGYADYVKARFADPNGPGARQDARAMEDLVAACHGNGLKLGLVLFPDTGAELGESYPFAFLHAREMHLCAAYGLTCLDLRPDFAAVANRRSLWVNPLDHHPSARANRIAADRIMAVFGPIWMALRRHS